MIGLDISRCIRPIENSLKVLTLSWNFQDAGFDEDYQRVTVKDTLDALLPLQLPALEDLSLNTHCETDIIERDAEGLLVYRSLAKSTATLINSLLENCDANLPCLKRVDIKVNLMVYEKAECDTSHMERPYQAKAIKVLRRYLSKFDDNGKFTFTRTINVFRRCMEDDTEEEEESSTEKHGKENQNIGGVEDDSGDNTADEVDSDDGGSASSSSSGDRSDDGCDDDDEDDADSHDGGNASGSSSGDGEDDVEDGEDDDSDAEGEGEEQEGDLEEEAIA